MKAEQRNIWQWDPRVEQTVKPRREEMRRLEEEAAKRQAEQAEATRFFAN